MSKKEKGSSSANGDDSELDWHHLEPRMAVWSGGVVSVCMFMIINTKNKYKKYKQRGRYIDLCDSAQGLRLRVLWMANPVWNK